MGTKGTKSSGTQFNPRGVTQGNTLVDPNTGLPISVTTDNTGTRRLAVDADITAGDITVETRDLTAATDAVRIEDPTTGAHVAVNPDGTIDVNSFSSAFAPTPDSELIVGTEDGTPSGVKHVAKIDANNNLNVINMGALVPKIFDYISITNSTISAQVVPTSIVYKVGGISGTTVATLTLTYDGSANLLTVGRT